MASIDNGMFINFVMSLLLKKIVVPSDFHNQVKAIKEMLQDDVSGLIDSLTDFAVDSAVVDYNIETNNSTLNEILKKWMDKINISYEGKVPPGIKALAEEYFKERWKYSSFPILRIKEWEKAENGIIVPSKMYFLDGGSIYAKEKNKDENMTLLGYNYYLGQGSQKPLEKGFLFAKTNGRWFDKYPIPYLIKRGIYHNYKIIHTLKKNQTTVLDQIIPYLLLIKKGTEGLATNNVKTYSSTELQQVINDFQSLMNELKSTTTKEKLIQSPIRASNFDEEIKHLIPDLSTIFDPKLFVQAERNILSGLGFIDVIQGISDTRRESVLNPKVFISEIKKGVEDFKNNILKPLIYMIQEKNKNHVKYMNSNFMITSSPIKGFMTDDFKETIRSLYDRGIVSAQTAVELVAEVEFETEVRRREGEAERGLENTLYPPIIRNQEDKGIDLKGKGETPEDEMEDEVPEDKKGVEKENYFMSMEELEKSFAPTITDNYIRLRQKDPKIFQKNYFRTIKISEKKGIKAIVGRLKGEENTTVQSYLFDKKKWKVSEAQKWVKENTNESSLEMAPYSKPSELPSRIRKNLSSSLQSTFIKVFNNALKQYENETRAFRVAWSAIKKIAKKNKEGIWVRKSSRTKLTKAEIEDIINTFKEE